MAAVQGKALTQLHAACSQGLDQHSGGGGGGQASTRALGVTQACLTWPRAARMLAMQGISFSPDGALMAVVSEPNTVAVFASGVPCPA